MMELDFELPGPGTPLVLRCSLQGPVTAVLGPAGSGKTAFLECVAGLRRRAQGRLLLNGRVLMHSKASVSLPPERRRLGFVPADARLFPHLSVAQNLEFGQEWKPPATVGPGRDEVISLLSLQPLLARRPSSLSLTEARRVALGRALLSGPELLLVDAPASPLEASGERMLPLLLRIKELWQLPMLWVAQTGAEAQLLADELMLLEGGAVRALGPRAEVMGMPAWMQWEKTGVLENVVTGTLETGLDGAVSQLRLSAATAISIPEAARAPGSRATYAVRAESLLIATAPPAHLSARNVFAGRVASMDEGDRGDVLARVEAEGSLWLVRLTRATVKALALAVNEEVFLAAPAHAFLPLDAPEPPGAPPEQEAVLLAQSQPPTPVE